MKRMNPRKNLRAVPTRGAPSQPVANMITDMKGTPSTNVMPGPSTLPPSIDARPTPLPAPSPVSGGMRGLGGMVGGMAGGPRPMVGSPRPGGAMFKKGGSVGSASKRADGIAVKGKTRGKIV